jgi:hypothetical protein
LFQLTFYVSYSTKDMTDASGRLLVKLPDIKFYLHKVKLFPETRQLYDEIAGQLKDIVAGFIKAGTAGSHYSHVRELLQDGRSPLSQRAR